MTVQINPPNAGEDASLSCDSTLQPCPLVEEEPRITIRASLFFDGTLNNRSNTFERLSGSPTFGDSYENDYSNIEKLQRYFESSSDADHSLSLYIEGIGTNNKTDDRFWTVAAMTGVGPAGIKDKVNIGLRRLVGRIRRLAGGNRRIDCIYIDTFGFSRGAAAARYCIYAIMNNYFRNRSLQNRLTAFGYSVNRIKIHFVGLFDTVSSFGADLNFDNDTEELHLDAISHAQRVVQLAAAEEHRKNFSLTNINSASRNGRHIYLPGVHSDIGGGYTDNAHENNLVIYQKDISALRFLEVEEKVNEEKTWLLNSGWYSEGQVTDSHFDVNPITLRYKITVNRLFIRNVYSRIPLHIMIRFAEEQGISFSNRRFIWDSIPSELGNIKLMLDEYISSHPGTGTSQASDWYENNSIEMRFLRHRYLHFSAHYTVTAGIAYPNKPRFSNDDLVRGKRRRNIISG